MHAWLPIANVAHVVDQHERGLDGTGQCDRGMGSGVREIFEISSGGGLIFSDFFFRGGLISTRFLEI